MPESMLKALVVDDEPIVRKMVAFALAKEGFSCSLAESGKSALALCTAEAFDLVVTDLRMANIHGHALVVELLARRTPSVIVVHSSVDDPRMARDLLARGVDDLIYKPANYEAFAVKARALVERRGESRCKQHAQPANNPDFEPQDLATGAAQGRMLKDGKLGLDEFERHLATVWKILPLSQAALAVLSEVRKDSASLGRIAGIIQQDAAISADVLRLANSTVYNASRSKIGDVEEAIVCIGTQALSEICVGMSALGALSNSVIPWLDKDLESQRSLASGIAVSRLLSVRNDKSNEDGVVLAAVMYPLGRVILGTLFPSLYRQMIADSRTRLVPLRQLEGDVFPESHSSATARVLALWGLPKDVFGPLASAAMSFSSLATLSEPTRSKVMLVKTGIVLGRLAVGRWNPEDLIELPPMSQVRRLGVTSLTELADQIQNDLSTVASTATSPDDHSPQLLAEGEQPQIIRYCSLSSEPFDFVRLLLISMGFSVQDVPNDSREFGDPLVINCINTALNESALHGRNSKTHPCLMLTDSASSKPNQNWGNMIQLPTSYGALKAACNEIAEAYQSLLHARKQSTKLKAVDTTRPEPQIDQCV